MALALLYLVSLHFLVSGSAQPRQEISLTKVAGKTALLQCHVRGLRSPYLHWYVLQEGEALTRVLYVATGDARTPEMRKQNKRWIGGPGFEALTAEAAAGVRTYTLKISDIKARNSGTYYCAHLDSHAASLASTFTTKTAVMRLAVA